MMYVLIVAALMFVFPVVSILIDTVFRDHGVLFAASVGKWFVFWAVGIRLLMAGLRQIFQPRYTAEVILGIPGEDSLLLVQELGFATTAIGCIGAGSIFAPGWIGPTAVAGAIFYGLAGINHASHKKRNRLQNTAMVSDLFVAVVLVIYCFMAVASKPA
jgi:hypothetical protein